MSVAVVAVLAISAVGLARTDHVDRLVPVPSPIVDLGYFAKGNVYRPVQDLQALEPPPAFQLSDRTAIASPAPVWSHPVPDASDYSRLWTFGDVVLRDDRQDIPVVGGASMSRDVVTAYDGATGAELWQTTGVAGYGSWYATEIGSEVWLFGSGEPTEGHDLRTGRLVIRLAPDADDVVPDGLGGVAAVTFGAATDVRADGTVRWTRNFDAIDDAGPAAFSAATAQYVFAARNGYWIGSTATGEGRLVPYPLGYAVVPVAAVEGNHAWVSTAGSALLLSLPTGAIVVRVPLGYDPHATLALDVPGAFVSLTPLTCEGCVADLAAHAFSDGRVVWRDAQLPFAFGYGLNPDLVGTVMVGSTDAGGEGTAAAVDLRTGRTVWTSLCHLPFGGDDEIDVALLCGTAALEGVDPETGAVRWSTALPPGAWTRTDAGLVAVEHGDLVLLPLT